MDEADKPDAYAFRNKNDGYITISRHLHPDFTFGLTIDEIYEIFEVEPVFFRGKRNDKPK